MHTFRLEHSQIYQKHDEQNKLIYTIGNVSSFKNLNLILSILAAQNVCILLPILHFRVKRGSIKQCAIIIKTT